MLLSVPVLAGGWALTVIGIYFLGASIFEYPTTEDSTSLAAIWAFMFSFGAVSIAVLLAAKANFASIRYVRQIYKYSMVVSAVLFLGYLIIGMLVGLIGWR
jgi:hypothetical protein